MKWKIVAVGKPSLAYARLGAEDYLSRLKHYATVETLFVKESGSAGKNSKRLLSASEGCLRLVLDERGTSLSTPELVDWVRDREMEARGRPVAVLIGGADGHGEEARQKADLLLNLGRLTLQHELAMLVFLEQLYRVHTVIRGEPYHR